MKIEFRDNNLVVFLNKKIIEGVNFFDNSELENYFKGLFLKIDSDYGIDMEGSYNISVFIDEFFGAILEVVKDEQDYYDYYDSIVMNISVSKYRNFLYKLNGWLSDFKNCNLYVYNGSIYISPCNVDFYSLGIIIENSEIIYGKECFDILKNAKSVSDFLVVDKIL